MADDVVWSNNLEIVDSSDQKIHVSIQFQGPPGQRPTIGRWKVINLMGNDEMRLLSVDSGEARLPPEGDLSLAKASGQPVGMLLTSMYGDKPGGWGAISPGTLYSHFALLAKPGDVKWHSVTGWVKL